MWRLASGALAALALLAVAGGATAAAAWRQMTEKELRAAIPERAQVEGERIETEFRSASGCKTDDGAYVAGVVLITAGYSADGKYSHWLTLGTSMKTGDVSLAPGEYVFGSQRASADELEIRLYEAATGRLVGATPARKSSERGPIRSFAAEPADDGTVEIHVGRFAFDLQTETRQ